MVKVAVVTGSNKGIGFAIVKGLLQRFDGVVYLTSRDAGRGRAAVAKLNAIGLKPKYHQLDVSDRNTVFKFKNYLKERYGGVNILINNAGVLDVAKFYSSYEECRNIININYSSILTIQDLLFPLVKDNGRILNISSSCGHLCNIKNDYWIHRLSKKDLTVSDVNEFVNWFLKGVKNGTFNYNELADGGTIAAYRISKVALSAISIIQQKELQCRNISVNSVHPGFTQTDMTIGSGSHSTDQAAQTPLYLALEAPETLKGSYVWYDRKVLDWYDYKADHFFKTKSLNT